MSALCFLPSSVLATCATSCCFCWRYAAKLEDSVERSSRDDEEADADAASDMAKANANGDAMGRNHKVKIGGGGNFCFPQVFFVVRQSGQI